jgi:hypothetical protein
MPFKGETDATGDAWIRSSKCVNGNCVEVRSVSASILVRDGAGQALSFDHGAWTRFIEAVKGGELR